MSFFKIFKGDSSRISMDATPFHNGYAYFTPDDGGLYIDSAENGVNKRIRVDGSSSVSGVLPSNKWTDNRQTVLIPNLGVSQNGLIGLSQDATNEQVSAANMARIRICGQEDGSLTLAFDGDTPACDIPYTIILFG